MQPTFRLEPPQPAMFNAIIVPFTAYLVQPRRQVSARQMMFAKINSRMTLQAPVRATDVRSAVSSAVRLSRAFRALT